MYLSKLIDGLGTLVVKRVLDGEVEISDLSTDSKHCGGKWLFICLKGGNADGHDFVKEAERNGAVAVVAEKEIETALPMIIVEDSRKALGYLASLFYGEPTKKLKVIGITGTHGKTTTSYMVASILQQVLLQIKNI